MPKYKWWFKPLVFSVMLLGDWKLMNERTQVWLIRRAAKRGVIRR